MNAKEALDSLLEQNREFERVTGPGSNNHVPMVLIALYRMGGSPDRMVRYVESFDLREKADGKVNAGAARITLGNWRDGLGHDDFAGYTEFFDRWTSDTSLDAVLRESVPVLMEGVCTEAYHGLLRLSYALDYESREEAVYALSYWASKFYTGPQLNVHSNPVEPEALLSEIRDHASSFQMKMVHSIDGRLRQVYDDKTLAPHWKPIRISESDPLKKISLLILELFQHTQHFTLLHALTSCQALSRILPFLENPRDALCRYWHSVCGAFLTVERSGFNMRKDAIVLEPASWKDLASQAMASEESMEHRVKLTYSCWLEFQRTQREEYRALAAREIRRASPFV